MATMLDFKCPCCSGNISFDSTLQKMKCPYCDTEFDIDTLKSYDESLKNAADDINWSTSGESEWSDEGDGEMNEYVCQSCGGVIAVDSTTAATECPYCQSPVVLSGKLSGVLRPDYIIPFKLSKKDAVAAFSKHLTGKKLLPKVFKDKNHIDEIKGVYVPVWLFSADAKADIHYRATQVRTWSDSDYDYTETRHYSVWRAGKLGFEKIPVDGSEKMADELMESIEPFDFSGAVDFKTAYLAGYLADKYDVTAEQSIDRANSRIKQSTADAFASTVTGYASVTPENTGVQVASGKAQYAMYPVWLMNTTYNNQKYTFAMNGQTGKFVGNLPLDKGAFFRWFSGIAAAVTAAVSVAAWLLCTLQ